MRWNVPRVRVVVWMVALLLVTPAWLGAQSRQPRVDLALDGHTVQEDGGVFSVRTDLRVRTCDGGFSSDVVLVGDGGLVLASHAVQVEIVGDDGDIGGKCANTSTGSCAGVACPDAIVNGKRRKGTCSDSIVLCVCDYGVATIGFEGVVASGTVTLFADSQNAVSEVSEANNHRAVDLNRAAKILAAVETAAGDGRLEDSSADGTRYTQQRLESAGDAEWVVQAGLSNLGSCQSQGWQLENGIRLLATSHSCSGDPCSACQFVHNASGDVIGCKCVENPNNHSLKCNHTISTGMAVDLSAEITN
jgi:hypothetical protein